jgi:hypothetical protein
MSLEEELIKVVVDKLLLGTVLGVFGFYLNTLLERLRTRLSFSTELNKERVPRIAEVWQRLYEFEHCANPSSQPHVVNSSRVQQLFDELHELMEHNRFWIGERAFGRINSYKILLKDLTDARAAQQASRVCELEAQLKGARQHVTDVREDLLGRY